ncbi:MAG: hypothetical protein E7185_00350 [Erysipelotrichaceae bacterium]|nr:hypothetical protein [Erysipelotrichaceae bacterium]
MNRKVSIADINISVSSPFDIITGKESEPFLKEFKEPDCILEYHESDQKDFSDREQGTLYVNRLFCCKCNDEIVYQFANPGQEPYGKVTILGNQPYRMRCDYLKGNEKYITYLNNIYTVFGLETILLRFNALILHASFIRWGDMGILFSATSGVGKSTQASLWEQYENAEIINGDRAVIRKSDVGWLAYGLPLAGSSGICKNEKTSLKCIILLEQAKENTVHPASASEAYRFLYPEVMIHRWDRIFEKKASSYLLEIIQEIPVIKLCCTPDQDAVKELKRYITENLK